MKSLRNKQIHSF